MSGRRRTAFFFALWSMASKLALAMAVGIAFPVLGASASPPTGPTRPDALLGLALLYALAAGPVQARGDALVWRFELDATRQKRLRAQIETAAGAV